MKTQENILHSHYISRTTKSTMCVKERDRQTDRHTERMQRQIVDRSVYTILYNWKKVS